MPLLASSLVKSAASSRQRPEFTSLNGEFYPGSEVIYIWLILDLGLQCPIIAWSRPCLSQFRYEKFRSPQYLHTLVSRFGIIFKRNKIQ